MSCQCPLDRALLQNGDTITIAGAQKQLIDKTTFVVYTISFQDNQVKRRYSDFDSLRNALTRLYPYVLVPPIPEKHTLSAFANYTHTHMKDEQAIIDKRKRLLQNFLVRLALHPRLSREHVFHRFLDNTVTWSEVQLPTGTNEKLPNNAAMQVLKEPDLRFTEIESAAEKHAEFANNQLDRSQRRVLRRLEDLSSDFGELAASYHMLSRNEVNQVALAMENIGLAANATCGKTQQMIRGLEIDFAEHMQTYAQGTLAAKQVLRYRRAKHAQLELIGVSLEDKKAMLHMLLQTEDKALRLEAAMNEQEPSGTLLASQTAEEEDGIDTRSVEDGFSTVDLPKEAPSKVPTLEYPSSVTASALRASRDRYKKWSSPRKLLNAMSYTIQGIIDVDPEATRRNQIDKLKEDLERSKVRVEKELEDVSENVQRELDMFQKQRLGDLRAMMIAFAKIHVQYCEENMASWQKARKMVDEIYVEDQ
ncbi:hypothetical protein BX666DRAFT_2024362 [Dichotomocladium elegans]|nr:hypothetical protein BX666DRAFT_2024362 [Dichotomocladium elegans]